MCVCSAWNLEQCLKLLPLSDHLPAPYGFSGAHYEYDAEAIQ